MGVEVQTVSGPIRSDALGVTLPHEHVFIDERPLWRRPDPTDDDAVAFAQAPVGIELIGRLRHDPMACLDNLSLADEQAAIEELGRFKAAGRSTIIDPTCRGMGRDPKALRRVSAATG